MITAPSAGKADEAVARKADGAKHPIRVLLVEDDEDDYHLTRDLLQEIGRRRFTLDWEATFDDAVAAMARQKHDVYLVDYRLGGHNGLELLTEADRRGVPVILLTGLDDWDVDTQAAKAGAADYLVKGKIDAPLLERSIRYAIERKRAEEALKEADRRKDEFLAMLAHELRNPLAPVRTALEVMRLRSSDDPDQERARDIIERQVQQMTRLVDDLLDVSRITRGKIKLLTEPVDLAAVITRAVEISRPLIDARQHQLTVTLPPHPVLLDADLTRLAQVVANLLNNAAKYTERGGHIRLTVEKDGKQAVVRVRDTGVGIPAEMLTRVFDLFAQVDHSVERSQGGLGIGLTLVKNLVEMHGGTVTAHSSGPGRGSEFIVGLPALAEARASEFTQDVSGQPAALPARRILLVDDNPDAVECLGLLLRMKGNEVYTASDGPEALEAAKKYCPDVVLLDIGLPKMSGYEVCRRLRQQHFANGLLIVALTGYGQDKDRRRTREAGFDHHLLKPVDSDTLENLLGSAESVRPRVAPPARRILLADDNVDFAEMMAQLLRWRGGHEVQVVHDGEAALAAVQTFQPEVAFLDIGLPGINGYRLAQQLRQQPGLEGVLLVALTGYGQEEDRRRALAVGFDEHLTKPVGFETLQRLLAARSVAAKV
jgi:CheY-like chemotaxis protein/anti-sigma regulatory factor (Ser/Thr protein kinase)